MSKLTLISFPTCPYVQRAVIALKEKGVPFEVIYIDLANKPDWFLAISPLGKVPVLKVERDGHEPAIVFESAVILEYLEDTITEKRLHPIDTLERAQHRSWIEFGSQVLGDLWRLSAAKDQGELDNASQSLATKLRRLEDTIVGPFFAGTQFSLVDAVFAPAFRQLDALETVVAMGLTADLPKLSAWRKNLAARPSVKEAAPADFVDLYLTRLRNNDAHVLKAAA
ncbi:glutathione S-transferase family protein [Devosia sp.]|uniref:glutathione S-transferase family protein n=1 Tax=Devosia sp. TaxID=1871048 RepID=UPI001B213693|nr:glutathione S-transferase family protein [Devosia sp.]MBO9590709.1 glutathione S-transferase family protein [Devosia sp.]